MRTKTLLLAAALTAAGIACYAQSNVYSVNVVGYVNVTVAPGFTMIANPLNATNNTLASLIPAAPDGAQVIKFVGSGYQTFIFDGIDNAWTPDGNATLNPGEGAFFKNNTANPLTLTFVGEVLQGSLTNALPAGFAIASSKVPQAGTVTQLGLPGEDGDQVIKWNGAGYSTFIYDGIDNAWTPSTPSVNVGESFWTKLISNKNWVRNFTVP